jgi:hypothetical protein
MDVNKKLKIIQVTQQEIQDAMKNSIYKNKKKYTRKSKHKGIKHEFR